MERLREKYRRVQSLRFLRTSLFMIFPKIFVWDFQMYCHFKKLIFGFLAYQTSGFELWDEKRDDWHEMKQLKLN